MRVILVKGAGGRSNHEQVFGATGVAVGMFVGTFGGGEKENRQILPL